MRPKSLILLVIALVASGCLELTGPVAERTMQRAGRPRRSPEVAEQRPRLSTRVEVTPRLVVIGDQLPGVITVEACLTNHEDTQVTLTGACLLPAIRAIHTRSPIAFNCVPTTISLAPGQTVRQQIELPDVVFQPDTYQFSASVVGYGFESPPAILRVVRP